MGSGDGVDHTVSSTASAENPAEDPAVPEASTYKVGDRVEQLGASNTQQMKALFYKSYSFESRRTQALCCMSITPIVFVFLLVMLQYLIDSFFLSKSSNRCPYCGPGEPIPGYCKGQP